MAKDSVLNKDINEKKVVSEETADVSVKETIDPLIEKWKSDPSIEIFQPNEMEKLVDSVLRDLGED